MGYDPHMTRRAKWADPDRPAIAPGEWEAAARSAGLCPMPMHAADGALIMDDPGPGTFAVLPDGDEPRPLSWTAGSVSARNPPPGMIRRMHLLATGLGARVRGDDDELYGPGGEIEAEAGPGWLSRLPGRN